MSRRVALFALFCAAVYVVIRLAIAAVGDDDPVGRVVVEDGVTCTQTSVDDGLAQTCERTAP